MENDNDISLDEYFLESGQIFITGEIKEEVYLAVSRQLRYMRYLNISPIRIYINSVGGDVESSLAIIDEFKLFQKDDKEIFTIATGQCCSSAAFILAYGSKRFATENAVIMVHPFSYDMGESEHQASLAYVKFAEQLYKDLMVPLAYRCHCKSNKEVDKFISSIRDGKWMNVEEAKEFGLIDDVWDYSLEKI